MRPSPKDPDPTVRCALAHASTIIAPWGDHAMTTAAGQRNRGLTAMAMDKLIQLWVCICWSASFFWQGHQTLEALLSLLDDSHYEATGVLEDWLLRFAGLPQNCYLNICGLMQWLKSKKKKKPAKKSVWWAAFDLVSGACASDWCFRHHCQGLPARGRGGVDGLRTGDPNSQRILKLRAHTWTGGNSQWWHMDIHGIYQLRLARVPLLRLKLAFACTLSTTTTATYCNTSSIPSTNTTSIIGSTTAASALAAAVVPSLCEQPHQNQHQQQKRRHQQRDH